VGCGYAARAIGDHVRLLRLSDGRSWRFEQGSTWQWLRPLVVTCEEMFACAYVARTYTIVRVRIDSLGPGEAPD
jgi:hypothetical protein